MVEGVENSNAIFTFCLCSDGFVCVVRVYCLDVPARAEPLSAVGSNYGDVLHNRKVNYHESEDVIVPRFYTDRQSLTVESCKTYVTSSCPSETLKVPS
jgi:hypothetical protein